MQCNVEFGYQLIICSGTEGNHGNPLSSRSVALPSGCKLTSSQQSGIKYASRNIGPYLCCFFLLLPFVEVEVTLRPTVIMSLCPVHYGTCDLILLPVVRLLSENCGLVSVGRPL
jgi:hypothetical protein